MFHIKIATKNVQFVIKRGDNLVSVQIKKNPRAYRFITVGLLKSFPIDTAIY